MVRKVIVGNSNPGGPHYRINQSVLAVGERAMIDPDLTRSEDGDSVAVRFCAPPIMRRARADVSLAGRDAVVNVDVVDYNIADVLERDAPSAYNVHVSTAAVDCLETVDDQLLFELDEHVAGEDDP